MEQQPMNQFKKCKHCGQDIFVNVKVCPKCRKSQKRLPTWAIVLICIFFIAGIGGATRIDNKGTNNDSDSTTTSDETTNDYEEVAAETEEPITEPTEEPIEYIKIKVDKLEKELDKNAYNAKNKYCDKYLEITGKLSNIDSDGDYISLESIKETYNLVYPIRCDVSDESQLEAISKYSVGDKITLKVKITDVGEVMGYSSDIIEID